MAPARKATKAKASEVEPGSVDELTRIFSLALRYQGIPQGVLVHDLSEGPRRFSELEHSCAGISPRTLSERLRALEDEGIVGRHSYAESPPRVEYDLTSKGLALLPIITEMRQFGHAYLTD